MRRARVGSDTGNPESEIQNPKSETKNPKFKSWNPKQETKIRNLKSEI
jgi:hypothetical protein